jgi:hypothetical protein
MALKLLSEENSKLSKRECVCMCVCVHEYTFQESKVVMPRRCSFSN